MANLVRPPLADDDETEDWTGPFNGMSGFITTLDRSAAPEEPLPDPEPIGFLRFSYHLKKKRKRGKRKA